MDQLHYCAYERSLFTLLKWEMTELSLTKGILAALHLQSYHPSPSLFPQSLCDCSTLHHVSPSPTTALKLQSMANLSPSRHAPTLSLSSMYTIAINYHVFHHLSLLSSPAHLSVSLWAVWEYYHHCWVSEAQDKKIIICCLYFFTITLHTAHIKHNQTEEGNKIHGTGLRN